MAAQPPHLAALRSLDDLDFERCGIRFTLAHGNPSDKGDHVRLKIRGHYRPSFWRPVGVVLNVRLLRECAQRW